MENKEIIDNSPELHKKVMSLSRGRKSKFCVRRKVRPINFRDFLNGLLISKCCLWDLFKIDSRN